MPTTASEIDAIATRLDLANKAYHQEDAPVMDDAAYDALKCELLALEEANPDLKRADSPTDQVGASPAAGFRKIAHVVPMLSLGNAFTEDDVAKFVRGIHAAAPDATFTAEPKIDGISLAIRYENGKIVHAVTRGDGKVGEDVTANAMTISDIPHLIASAPAVLEVRGEVYMRHDVFQVLQDQAAAAGKSPLANPRNAAAGSMRQLDARITANRKLSFFAYSWGDMSAQLADTQSGSVARLAGFGFKVNPLMQEFSAVDTMAADLVAYHTRIAKERAGLGYDIDGIVYKVESLDTQDELGFRSTTPRWAIAHKFAAETAWTRLVAIDIQVGRTGALSPVARLVPVNVGGVMVSNATLHNADYIAGRDVSGQTIRRGVDIRVGDLVEVYRAGDVIPKIGDVDIEGGEGREEKRSLPYVFPDKCPDCQSAVILEGSTHRCTGGLACTTQCKERLKHLVSKDALDIVGMGESVIDALWDHPDVKLREPAEIFSLEERHGDSIAGMPGWGATSAGKLFKSIDKAAKVPIDRLIFGLGLRHVGATTAAILARHYLTWGRFEAAANNIAIRDQAAIAEMQSLDGIGPSITDALREAFGGRSSLSIITLSNMLDIIPETPPQTDTKIAGLTVVFTGTLLTMTRSQAQKQAEQLGAKVSGAVSAKTDILVAGPGAGSKADKAEALGVRIIDEDTWNAMVST